MTRVDLTIPNTEANFSVLQEWSHSLGANGILLVAPDYIPGCRMSFSFRSLPKDFPALAFIHEQAKTKGATVCKSGDNWYIFYPETGEDAKFAEEGTRPFCWEIAIDHHHIAVFAEVPQPYVEQAIIERLVVDMADVVESANHP